MPLLTCLCANCWLDAGYCVVVLNPLLTSNSFTCKSVSSSWHLSSNPLGESRTALLVGCITGVSAACLASHKVSPHGFIGIQAPQTCVSCSDYLDSWSSSLPGLTEASACLWAQWLAETRRDQGRVLQPPACVSPSVWWASAPRPA